MTKNILIIGDDITTHLILDRALAGHDCQISVMSDRRSAVFPCDPINPDLIIFDSLLPGTDGWNALPRIRQLCSVPIIALTDAQASQVRVDSLDRGADYCLAKPFDIQELQARVRVLLRHSHGSQRRAIDC